MTRHDEHLHSLLFPNDESDSFEIDLRWHLARAQAAIRFLDESKIHRLRSRRVVLDVIKLHLKWSKAVGRVISLPEADE